MCVLFSLSRIALLKLDLSPVVSENKCDRIFTDDDSTLIYYFENISLYYEGRNGLSIWKYDLPIYISIGNNNYKFGKQLLL